jgi:hypothetical protein
MYVKVYPGRQTVFYRSIPAASFHAGTPDTFVAGSIGKDPLFALLDGAGTQVFQNRYAYGDEAAFHRSVKCDNGDFLLYGELRKRHLLLRARSDGNVIWSKTYFTERTFSAVDLVKCGSETYYFVSRGEASLAPLIEITKIDANGIVSAAIHIQPTEDSPVAGLIAYKDGCAVYGHTGHADKRNAFIAVFDQDLVLQQASTIGDADDQSAASLLNLNGERLVLTGETGRARDSYITQFRVGDSTVPALVLDFKRNSEEGHKMLRNGPGLAFYLIAEMPADPRLSFIAKFSDKFQLLWMRKLNLRADHVFHDLQSSGEANKEELVICGVQPAAGAGITALMARTDRNMNSCATLDLPLPRAREQKYVLAPWDIRTERIDIRSEPLEPRAVDAKTDQRAICDSSPPPDTKNNPKYQSPYIYLQAVGSDGSDDTVSGFHLRWEFMRRLGEQHLAKGDLAAPTGRYPTNIAFNRPDDYVRLYKTAFTPEFGITIDFRQPPSFLLEWGPFRSWCYADVTSSAGLKTDVLLRFTDTALYTLLRQSINPMTHPQAFIAQYAAPIELHTAGKLFFYVDAQLASVGGGRMRLETISLPDALDPGTRHVSSRRLVGPQGAQGIVGENFEYLRFQFLGLAPLQFHVILYQDYLTGVAARDGWELVGRYALDDGESDASAAVFRRLEDPSRFTIDRRWRKFNEPTATEFRVNVNNYRMRWSQPADGLQAAVETYLTTSQIDPLANVTLPNQDPQPNDSETEISYLRMLQFAGLDFHVARMLGLGTIVPADNLPAQVQMVYLMQYYTQAQLENETPATVSHLYMAPPVSTLDHRLPPAPELLPVVYGLQGDSCGAATPITDANGYVPYADVRYINLHRRKFKYELPFEPFFADTSTFDLFKTTQPVLFGVEYGPGPVGTGFVRPEISKDTDWLDPGGLPEVRSVPDTGENPVYTHAETETGIHHYGLYSINWFARPGAVSNEVQTDFTSFEPRNTMVPPANFKVYLVQREPALILSTQVEQDMLSALTGGDKTLVRATFNWNQVQNTAYQFADRLQFFFRVAAPRVVKGKIVSVISDALTHTALLATGPYTQSSQPATIQPHVDGADMPHFAGAALVAGGQTFLVNAVLTSGDNPQIRVEAIRQTASTDSLNENIFCTTESFIDPQDDVEFIMVENLGSPAAWDTQLAKEVQITHFIPAHTETETQEDGTSTTLHIGGLTDSAVIANIFDPDPDLASFVPANGPPATEVPTGVYTVTFDHAVLGPHPDADVSYYQGTIRLRAMSGAMRELVVWTIDATGSTLRLVVYDPTFALKRDATGMFVITGSQFTPEDGTDPVLVGAVPFANFHPGYRVYLHADVAGGHNFGEPAILPAPDEGTKYTYMSVRCTDSSTPGMASYLTPPVVLLALEIREPVPPAIPLGPLYATRPNFYGKATYTFDTLVNQPFSLIFYRANERSILDQLYDAATVRGIYVQLQSLPEHDAEYETNRWSDLVNMVTDIGGQFMQYVPGGFRFPPPNNPRYQVPGTAVHPFGPGNTEPPGSSAIVPGTGRSWAAIVKEAINGAFLPLTETPPVYSLIRDTTMQTSGRPPVIRDANGNRLAPGDPLYDPWPMAVRFEKTATDQALVRGNAGYGDAANRRYVRFTDYTLDGAARNTYFYGSRELSSALTMSAMSAIVGPITLVNSAPAEAPGIGRVTVAVANKLTGEKDGVRFELNEYLGSEGIRQVQLYRALSADDALSIRTMALAKSFAAGTDLVDTFDDLPFCPYGDPLFYRIVALREIRNEHSASELIPSKSSNVVMASLIDSRNPPAPRLSFSSDAPMGSPLTLHNVTLTWEPTCHNGTYHLYKRSKAGNWIKIATQSGNDPLFYQPLATSELNDGSLLKQDDEGNRLYHHFRVVAMNSAGLLSREESVLTI